MVVAAAAATMLGAPFALLHGGVPARPAAPGHVASAAPVGRSLGPTQLVAATTSTPASPARLAAHRSAVRHLLEVKAALALHHRRLVHAAAVRSHEAWVAELTAQHATAVTASNRGSARSSSAAPGRVRRPVRFVFPPTVPIAPGATTAKGGATWYAWHPGQCASPFLPHGTLLTVTDLATGKTIQCLVTDTEGHNPGRVVDLSNWCFEELAPLSQGVIEVRISW